MENLTYWHKQTATKPLFPDILWNKPERRDQAGRLAIIGGNKLGFAGVAEAYRIAQELGVGSTRVLLPKALKPMIPSSIGDALYSPSTTSGGLAKDASVDLIASLEWADVSLLIGDAGRNSETAIAYETALQKTSTRVVLTRDAIDLVKNGMHEIVDRPNTIIVASFAQVQKIFQAVYYPKVLSFSMQLMQLVEAVHKFTITYPITLVLLHQETIIVAHDGQVITQAWTNPMRIWRGDTAARAASFWLWSPDKPIEAIATSLAE